MKIADLKQPYRRMAEYLADKNTYTRFSNKEILNDSFDWYQTNVIFWLDIADGDYPPITEEIKKHFPPDFDFSGEEVKTKPVIQMLDAETQKYIYTQLAKESKFDELPDTCEFSEAVELEVWDSSQLRTVRQITGKYKDMYVDDDFDFWDNAKLPTHKIDFLQFKEGDVVEVETISVGYMYGYIREVEGDKLLLSLGYMSDVLRTIRKEKIKSITKIK